MEQLTPYGLFAILVVMTCVFSYLNYRFVKFPPTIGVMAMGLIVSVILVSLDWLHAPVVTVVSKALSEMDFSNLLLYGMLGFMLFAGALQLDLSDFLREKWQIAVFALGSTFLSTLVVGGALLGVSRLLGLPLQFIECLIFGALISPTDPIATLAILLHVGAPKRLRVDITGESLFNDAVGVVLFLTLVRIYQGGRADAVEIAGLFLLEAGGGVAFGLLLGFLGSWLMGTVQCARIQVMITLAVVAGGYGLADALSFSGPLVVIMAGLVIGSRGMRRLPEGDREQVRTFWRLVDDVLNATLFVMVGLEVVAFEQYVLKGPKEFILAGLIAIPLVLLARLISVAIPLAFLRRLFRLPRHTLLVMTWGGLRGALCIALAFAIPQRSAAEVDFKGLALMMTYMIAVFSILAQGLTIGPLCRRALKGAGEG